MLCRALARLHSESESRLTPTLQFLWICLNCRQRNARENTDKNRVLGWVFCPSLLGAKCRNAARPAAGLCMRWKCPVCRGHTGSSPALWDVSACSGLLRFPSVHEPRVNDDDADEKKNGALRCHPKIQRPAPNHHRQITRKKAGAKADQQPDQQKHRGQNAFFVNERHDIQKG